VSKKQGKKTKTPAKTTDGPKPKTNDKKLKGFQIIQRIGGEESITPRGDVRIHPECHDSRRTALDYLRKAVKDGDLPEDAHYGVIQVKEWGLRPEVTKVTKITF
jgi:hypothetical protein